MRSVTIIKVPDGGEEEVERLFKKLQERDSTWEWEFKTLGDIYGRSLYVLIYSGSRNQAEKRGRWLMENTEIFFNSTYTVKSQIPRSLKEKPKKTLGLREYLKRKEYWERLEE